MFVSSLIIELSFLLQYYQLPHCFLFTRAFNAQAIMRYKLFSTHAEWLPKFPIAMQNVNHTTDGLSGVLRQMESYLVDSVETPELAVVGGPDSLLQALGIQDQSARDQLRAPNANAAALRDAEFFGILKSVADKCVQAQAARMEYEATGGHAPRSNDFGRALCGEMLSRASADTGFIIWLDIHKPNVPPFDAATPRTFNPRPLLSESAALDEDSDNERDGAPADSRSRRERVLPPSRTSSDIRGTGMHKKALAGAKDIYLAAKSMLQNYLVDKKVTISTGSSFNFQKAIITPSEHEFYMQRSSKEAVLRWSAEQYEEIPEGEWEALPLPALTDEDQERIMREREKALQKSNEGMKA